MATTSESASRERWEEEAVRGSDSSRTFTTVSGRPIKPLYLPEDLPSGDYESTIGYPGQAPFRRGIHASMYRGRLWTMRQFAGFGTARETNERFKYLVSVGQTGLSTAFDLPTLMGLDSDDDRSIGEVGKLGVAIDTMDDVLVLYDGIDIGKLSVSMTINAPAIVLMAFYLAAAQDRGFDWKTLRGTAQNDILKEFHAQNEYVFPPEPSVRLVVDVIEFCARHVPQWYPVSISGYHIREAGSTAAQELAFTLADGLHYVDKTLERGLGIDEFAHRLSFFFNAHNDLFEEIAKYRAARVVWCESMRDHYGAQSEASWKLRFHAQTAGCSLQDKIPELNLVRVAYQALAAVLGGCQSLHTNSMDETLALPSEHAAMLALLTQKVVAHETGVVNSADPLGGSYMVERLTDALIAETHDYFAQIEQLGGMLAATEQGFFRRQIADAAFAYQREVDAGRKLIVGVNAYQAPEEKPIELLEIDPDVEARQVSALRNVKQNRSGDAVRAALDQVRRAAETDGNLLPPLMEAARVRATLGESMDAMADVFGRYDPVM